IGKIVTGIVKAVVVLVTIIIIVLINAFILVVAVAAAVAVAFVKTAVGCGRTIAIVTITVIVTVNIEASTIAAAAVGTTTSTTTSPATIAADAPAIASTPVVVPVSMSSATGTTCLARYYAHQAKPKSALDYREPVLRYTESHLDTIYALSTHPGKAGVAVIRVSGPHAKQHDVSWSGTSKTTICGESEATVSIEWRALGQRNGDMVSRAFENDKFDLTEIEGLADLLNAETEAQRRLALRQADGGLRLLYDNWRTELIKSMALVEALIDFGEDENIEDDVYDTVIEKVTDLYRDIKRHTEDDRCGEILRDGIQVTILGPPNAGKSSFLNFITKRQAAIVSPIPGTTRDIVEVSLDVGGYPIIIGDTAGLRSSTDVIEMEGVRRAQDRIQTADINIAILPVTDFLSPQSEGHKLEANAISNTGVDPVVLNAIRKNPKTMVLINKMDLFDKDGNDQEMAMAKIRESLWPEFDQVSQDTKDLTITGNIDSKVDHRLWAISCEKGEGISGFLKDLVVSLKDRFNSSLVGGSSITQYRHRKHLENCLQSLEAFMDLGADDVVLGAEELRHAASDLGRITGRVDVEDVLDVVFREFCIGK
ncbi:tRNA modification GTPase gtpbp3, mitochondrial, partial [Lunasporangiospora selenospora]